MRTIRALTATLALVAALPVAGEAQIGRPFKNSWYWGAKVGTLLYSTPSTSNAMAPMGGGEWLITRSRAGMYMSYSHAIFNRTELMQAEGDTVRAVDLNNLRRIDMALLAFPGSSRYFKPYAGIGFSLNQIITAIPQGTYENADQFFASDAMVKEFRTSITPLIMAGFQLNGPLIALFAQGSATSAHRNFFLHGTNAFNLAAEAGVRFNFGTSIDRN